MSNCDCQENIDNDEATIATTVAEKSIGDRLLITTVAATCFGLRTISVVQNDALITST